ncbi:sigma-54-dependent Fis family transcriptional regulator [uncultured Megasphaera sp.]|uniref:sigma-54 interaction domain-containing protein n=1 Tax=uncultured Megasphaera sp. TaxID=165188 RepID=UPI0012E2D3A1|nr:sigma 54-interacting transcriptional regulator [uncultured Megasphaera sp.]MUP58866.1 diguanylate cyclase [Veillonellaceae bacterium M2-4]
MIKQEFFSTIEDANTHLNAIIEHSFDGIFITDKDAYVLRINTAYESITGLKKEDVIGKNMKDLVTQKIISESASLLVIHKKKPVTLQQKFKTGKEALVTSSPIFDTQGNLIMVVTNVRDLSEIYNLKEAVERKNATVERLRLELTHLQETLIKDELIIKDESALQSVLLANRVAPLDTTVLLLGETGVGKEVLAHYIYQHSHRCHDSFIKVNCGAIPENLIESELFGYESGAFTGANRNGKMGLFELANKGTLFLDEVGELPKDMQVKLLRALQEQEIMRIGGTKPIKIDTRIIAATNRNLKEMVQQKLFREDLYYRLSVFPISLPPLRLRQKDIIPLAESFLAKLNQKYSFHKSFSSYSCQVLQEYNWPGNIRELKNIVERAIIISPENKIEPEDLHILRPPSTKDLSDKLVTSSKHIATQAVTPQKLPLNLDEVLTSIEYMYLQQAYEQGRTVRDAAKLLHITPSKFVRRRKRCQEMLSSHIIDI